MSEKNQRLLIFMGTLVFIVLIIGVIVEGISKNYIEAMKKSPCLCPEGRIEIREIPAEINK